MKRFTGGSTTAKRLISTKSFTVLNPSKYTLSSFLSHRSLQPHVPQPIDENFTSELVVATPQLANELVTYIHNASNNRQTVGIVTDSVPLGGQRNGFSILLSSQRFNLTDATELEENLKNSDNTSRTNPRGLAVGVQNWAPSNSFFALDIGENNGVVLPIANTLFQNGKEATMLYNDNDSLSGKFLNSLKVGLSLSSEYTPSFYAPLAPVKTDEPLVVTSVKDNLVKQINDRPAASYLEEASELKQGDASSQLSRRVFAFINSEKTPSPYPKRYRVIAGGGGGWSPRSTMLVLEPHARPQKGDKISFYYTVPEDVQFKNDLPQIQSSLTPQIVMESGKKIESLDEGLQVDYPNDHVLENSFGAGSEEGFLFNDVKYSVENELVVLK